MAEKNGIYKCEICGNLVEVIEAHQGELVCCGQPMKLWKEKTKEEGKEKHVPILEISENKVKVKVGSVPHPMEEKHYIELIEILQGDKVIASKRLYPNDEPTAEFCLKNTDNLTAREVCNIHGVWKN